MPADLLPTNVIYFPLVLISFSCLVEKSDRVGFCFLIDYSTGITHVPTSLSVDPTLFLVRANNFDAGTLNPLMWSCRSLATVYASHAADMFSLDSVDYYYYYDDGDGDDSFSGLKALWIELHRNVCEAPDSCT